MLDILATTPHIPFKLSLNFRNSSRVPGPTAYFRALRETNWKKLGEIVSSHPCKENKVTVVLAGPETPEVRDSVERQTRKELSYLDVKGWLEVALVR